MGDRWVSRQHEAFELLAFLITSAQGLVHEPREYGPQRLLMAAHRLVGSLLPRVDDDARPFLRELQQQIERLLPLPESEQQLVSTLDVCCRLVAKELVREEHHEAQRRSE